MAAGTAAIIGGAALGGLAGGMKDVSGSSSSNLSGINLAPESEFEQEAQRFQRGALGDFNQFVGQGPGGQDITAALTSQRGLASQLEAFAQGGFLPSESDTARAREFAASQFAPQQEVLKQSFQDAQIRANQLATQLGRSVDDPIIQARLQTDLARQQSTLGAQQNAFASQFAQNLPQQRLAFQAQLADVRGNLASQALSNRQALLSLGSQVQSAERQFRLNTGQRYSNTTQEQSSGGGLKGVLGGVLGGAGAGAGFASMFGGGTKGPIGSNTGQAGTDIFGNNAPLAAPGMNAGIGDFGSLAMGNFGVPSAPISRANRVTAGGASGASGASGAQLMPWQAPSSGNNGGFFQGFGQFGQSSILGKQGY